MHCGLEIVAHLTAIARGQSFLNASLHTRSSIDYNIKLESLKHKPKTFKTDLA